MTWQHILSTPLGIFGASVLAIIVIGLILVLVFKQGRSITLPGGIVIGERKGQPSSAPRPSSGTDSTGSRYEKLVYAKILSLRDRRADAPVYSREIDGARIPISDETIYVSLHFFTEARSYFKWNIQTSGIAESNVIYPWQTLPVFAGPLPGDPRRTMVIGSNQHSNSYVALSHFFNGQQPGHREVFIHIEEDAAKATLVLDLSSIEGEVRVSGLREFVNGGKQPMPVHEERHRIYLITDTELRMGETLRLTYTFKAPSA
jgi:hypothetical protein